MPDFFLFRLPSQPLVTKYSNWLVCVFHWIETSSKVILMEPLIFPLGKLFMQRFAPIWISMVGVHFSIYRDELFTHGWLGLRTPGD